MFFASDASEPRVSFLVAALLFLGGTLLYGFGYAMAVMRRANKDYKATKAAVPGLRKGYWGTWRAMLKAAFWVAVGAVVLIIWVARDFQDMQPASTPSPSPSITRNR